MDWEEDYVEKELQEAVEILNKCVTRIRNTGDAARHRMELSNVDAIELPIIDAIFDSCQLIASTSGFFYYIFFLFLFLFYYFI